MTLVDKALLDRLRQKQIAQSIVQPELNNMLQIQREIEEILKKSNLSDEEKGNILIQSHARYQKFNELLNSREVKLV